jgi:CBS domain containing-hemolysin-like protein
VISASGSGAVVGMVGMPSDRDICMAACTQGGSLLSCKPSDDLALAEAMMREARLHRISVIDEKGGLVGIVSLSDIVRHSSQYRRR